MNGSQATIAAGAEPVVLAPKPGYLTTEFYVTIITTIGGLLAAFAGGLPPAWAARIAMVSAGAYALSRAVAKIGPDLLLILGAGKTFKAEVVPAAAAATSSHVAGIIAALIFLPAFLFSGCQTAPVAPGNDPIVVHAEQTTRIALDTFKTIEKIEFDSYSTIKQIDPAVAAEIRTFVNSIRRQSPDWLQTARNVTEAYQMNRTAGNKASLDSAMAVLQVAIDESKKYLAKIPTKKSGMNSPPIFTAWELEWLPVACG